MKIAKDEAQQFLSKFERVSFDYLTRNNDTFVFQLQLVSGVYFILQLTRVEVEEVLNEVKPDYNEGTECIKIDYSDMRLSTLDDYINQYKEEIIMEHWEELEFLNE